MCGRFVITSPPAALRQIFGYIEQPNFPPRHNIAPTQPIPVIILENGIRHFRLMRWGLLPAWVKDPRKFALLINARAETVLEKPAFKLESVGNESARAFKSLNIFYSPELTLEPCMMISSSAKSDSAQR